MPVYEYVCATCRNRFEKLRPMSEMDDEAPCPDCGGDTSRALSVFAAFITDEYGNTRPTTNLGAGGWLRMRLGRRVRLRSGGILGSRLSGLPSSHKPPDYPAQGHQQ